MTWKALVEEWCHSESDAEITDQQSWLGWDGWVCIDDTNNLPSKNRPID